MGQLYISRRDMCYFVVYTSNWIHIEIIKYDSSFWENKMVNKLKIFYNECLLPEIVNPLYPKRMLKADIRESEIIKNSLRKAVNDYLLMRNSSYTLVSYKLGNYSTSHCSKP
ncbi:uncharacterized protein LOC112681685 [Sipha flava]|uniref:Uncharacterized protein LOC112681685 n=1 Tax=Sipha flava TaxID=143950 RepID=A0A8B8FBF8_9HEMI|nr:uncharacterized protein LOC112681685 [Sipha flava]